MVGCVYHEICGGTSCQRCEGKQTKQQVKDNLKKAERDLKTCKTKEAARILKIQIEIYKSLLK